MIKAILIDADGVCIKKHLYFSQRFSEEYEIPIEKIIPFVKEDLKLCSIGKADLKESLGKYIKDWNWDKPVEDLMDYWFSGENIIDEEVLNIINEKRVKGVKVCLVSDNEKYRAEYILNNMKFKDNFD